MKKKKWNERVSIYDKNGVSKKELEEGEPVAVVSAFRLSKIPEWRPMPLPNFSGTPRKGELLDIVINESFVFYGCKFLGDEQSLLPKELESYASRHGRTFWTLLLHDALGRSHIFVDSKLVFDAGKK